MALSTKIKGISITSEASILEALKQMDETYKRLFLVFKDAFFIGLLSIGDIQRAIIKGVSLEMPVTEIMRSNYRYAMATDSRKEIEAEMLALRAECMPVLDKDHNLVDVLLWEDVFGENTRRSDVDLKLPVVIMAGGKGSRLKPITNVLPKPLIPLGEKTIAEEIMDRFAGVGCNVFYLSVNYKAEMIRHYFDTLNNPAYIINYFQEDKPLGTAGSMFLLKQKINSTFFVTNCDIVIDQDLEEIYKYHIENKNKITIVSALKHYKIPYGILETGKKGLLNGLSEKPELTFQINSGMYILEPEMLELIPENEFYHITELIEKVKGMNQRVGVFPVSEGAWRDIGEWKEYLKSYI